MSNYPKLHVEIPRFNIIRRIANVTTAMERLGGYDDFFDQHGLADYKTADFAEDGLMLLGNKHLIFAARRSERFKRIPTGLLRDVLAETANDTTQKPLTLKVKDFDWLQRGENHMTFAAIVEEEPVVAEHEKFVDTLGRLAGLDIWPSNDSNHIPLAYCRRRLPNSLVKEFLDITPLIYHLNPATFIET